MNTSNQLFSVYYATCRLNNGPRPGRFKISVEIQTNICGFPQYKIFSALSNDSLAVDAAEDLEGPAERQAYYDIISADIIQDIHKWIASIKCY